MANLTALETRYLNAIVESDDHNTNGIEGAIDVPVWTWSPAAEFGKSAGGIASSLTKKGFVDGNSVGDKDDTIWLTAAGAEALIAHNARKHHPKHPTCGVCGKAVYKSDTVGKRVKKSDPWGYCRAAGCERNGRFFPVVGKSGHRTSLAA